MTVVLECGNAPANDVVHAPFQSIAASLQVPATSSRRGFVFLSAATRSSTKSQVCTPFTLRFRRLIAIGASRELASRMVAMFDRGHDLLKQCTARPNDTVGASSNLRRAMDGTVCIVARGLRRSVACLRGSFIAIFVAQTRLARAHAHAQCQTQGRFGILRVAPGVPNTTLSFFKTCYNAR